MSSSVVRRFWLLLLLVFSGISTAYAVVPTAPSNCVAQATSATGGNATISINWNDNSTNETSWRIQYSVAGGSYIDLGTLPTAGAATTGSTGVSWSTASLNTVYRFRIQALNATGFSAVSNVATVGTFDLNGPTNLTVAAVDPFNVVMSWEENSTGESGFAIESKLGSASWEYIGSVGGNSLSISPSLLIAPLGNYSFRVRAYKGSPPTTPNSPAGSSVSSYSNIATVTAGAYTLVAASVPGQNIINLSWPNILNESGYEILYKKVGEPSYSFLAQTNANVTTYQVMTANFDSAGAYMFLVTPFAGQSIIGASSEATATVDRITSKTGTSGTPGSLFSHTFTQTSGSSSAVASRGLTGVPSGLSFDPGTGVFSGVYPALGIYTLSYTVNFVDGGVQTQIFHIRVRPPVGAPVVGTVIAAWTAPAGASRETSLAGTFIDAEAESAVRLNTTLGNMDFVLFNSATPATVANFMNYVNSGKYTDVVFHRSISGFVIQGGGFKGTGTESNFTSVITNPTVVNEPGIANEFGTVSMAKLGGDPNSATSQFFVSLGDNRANLDFQNGGFTVFGRVAGNGMTVAQAISAVPVGTYNLKLNGSSTDTPFEGFPLNVPSVPTPMDQTKLLKINSATPIPTLSYAVTGNTNPAVASASIIGGQLRLQGLSGGQTTVTLTATDLDNLATSQTVAVTISDTFATWASRNTFPNGQSGPAQNPDGDEWLNLQEYAFLRNPGMSESSAQAVFQGVNGIAPAARYLTLTFPVRKFTQDLTYAVEASNSLTGAWTEIWKSTNGFSHPQVLSAVDQADRTILTIKDSTAMGATSKRFMRTRVVQQ